MIMFLFDNVDYVNAFFGLIGPYGEKMKIKGV